MNTAFVYSKLLIQSVLCILIAIIVFACHVNVVNIDQIKSDTDSLLNKIADGTANAEFSTKYFPADQTEAILFDLKNKCDFKTRSGNFINEHYDKENSKLSLIYEYYLKCDSIRLIFTYNMKGKAELNELTMEPIEKKNPMVTDSLRQLKY